MKIKQKYILLFSFLILPVFIVISSERAEAATLSVPSQFPTISSAISKSNNGDTVEVAAGLYREQINLTGKYITVIAVSGPNVTTIAPNSGMTGVMIQNVPYIEGYPRTTLKGFNITGGYAPDGQGGAITIANNADPIIEGNVLGFNQSLAHGGGILVYNNSDPTIKNNTITNNSVKLFGAGIFVVKNCRPIIDNNLIQYNSATGTTFPNGGSAGGGIYIENEPGQFGLIQTSVVTRNTIHHNSADFAGGGIMLRTGVQAIIENNSIYENTAAYGAGIHIETEGSTSYVSKNDINNNHAQSNVNFAGSGYGGGISVYASSKPVISQNTIRSNSSQFGGAGIVFSENSNSSLRANTINDNYTTSSNAGTAGGGVYISNATLSAVNNILDSNGSQLGGAIALLDGSNVSIKQNTIVRNYADWSSSPAAGGGVFVRGVSGVTGNITNNIFSGNGDTHIFEENSRVSISSNLFYNGTGGLYYNYSSGALGNSVALNNSSSVNATSNTDGNPEFINEPGDDFRIGATSSAIDIATSQLTYSDRDNMLRSGSQNHDIGAYEFGAVNLRAPVYRFWSDIQKGHFYTMSEAEKYSLISSFSSPAWNYEHIAYDASSTAVAGTTPLYRFWSDSGKSHFYTADVNEKNYIQATFPTNVWNYEGIAFYVYDTSDASSDIQLVYRFWSGANRKHFYTSSSAERDVVNSPPLSSIWTYENERFKVYR